MESPGNAYIECGNRGQAILKGIILTEEADFKQIVILAESMNACQALEGSEEDNYLVSTVWKEVGKTLRKEFVIQWIPSHCGIVRYEEADRRANMGCYQDSIIELPITYSDAMLIAQNKGFLKFGNRSMIKSP